MARLQHFGWFFARGFGPQRSEEHTSELQSRYPIAYDGVCV